MCPISILDKVNLAIQQALPIIEHNTELFTHHFQDSNSANNFYPPTENVEWTTGFSTGIYWLAYELTNQSIFKESALVHVDNFLNRIEQRIDVDHHDMGFLYSPSCVASYKLIGDEKGKKAALLAADELISRFHSTGNFIQAWGPLGEPSHYRLIIDCLLNLPLLYWASEVTGQSIYREIALLHTQTSLANLIRPDCSTYHTFFFDTETGTPLRGITHQGYKDNSAWARGQAWGIYGLALSYRYTQDPSCIELFKKVTDFFITHLPKDYVPYWDLSFTDGDDEPKDSSAAAIAICGILEMGKYLDPSSKAYYEDFAFKMMDSLIENYAVRNIQDSNGLLFHGVYAKNSPYNPIPKDRGVDECNIWGDYFYLEALTRLSKDWNLYW